MTLPPEQYKWSVNCVGTEWFKARVSSSDLLLNFHGMLRVRVRLACRTIERWKWIAFSATIPLALGAVSADLNAGPLALVASGVSSPFSVAIVDTATRSIVGTPISLAAASSNVIVDPNGDRAYVLSPHEHIGFGQALLFVVDIPGRRVIDTIRLTDGGARMAASPDGRSLYIAHPNLSAVSFVDTGTRAVTVVSIQNPMAIATDPSGEWLYVISRTEIAVTRVGDRAIVDRFPVPGRPIDVAITPDGRELVILDTEDGVSSGSVMVVSLGSRELTKRIPIGPRYHHLVIDGGGRRVFASGDGIDVKVIDLGLDGVSAAKAVRVGSGLGGGLALTPDNRELWVMNPADGTISVIDTHTLLVTLTLGPFIGSGSFGRFIGPPVGAAGSSRIVEFYSPSLDHYFMTQDPAEIAALDSKVHSGWGRTGQVFFSSIPGTAAQPVCRYYGLPSAGLNSHFYSASAEECAVVAQKFSSSWHQESTAAFMIELPEASTGNCPNGAVPVWRLWNGRTDSNHRYTTNSTIREAMVAQGYIGEGYGSAGAAMCSSTPQ